MYVTVAPRRQGTVAPVNVEGDEVLLGRGGQGDEVHLALDVHDGKGLPDARIYLLDGLVLVWHRGDGVRLAPLVDEEGVVQVGLVLELVGRQELVEPPHEHVGRQKEVTPRLEIAGRRQSGTSECPL